MFNKLKSTDPEGKFRFFKLLSVRDQFYSCDFFQHINEKGENVFNVKIQRLDNSTVTVQLVSKENWQPVKAYPGIADELIAQMNTVINYYNSGGK